MNDCSLILSKPGHSVRQAEEDRKLLEKENFNLKLRLFYLENKDGILTFSKAFKGLDSKRKLLDLAVENESLKKDLREQQELLKNSLRAIEHLERNKLLQEKKSKALIIEQNRKIELLKSKSKLHKKARKLIINPRDQFNEFFPSKIRNYQTAKSQNCELSRRIMDLKNELSMKTNSIKLLMNEKARVEIELKEKKTMCEELSKQTPENFEALNEENQQLKGSLNELTQKYQKLEMKSKELERLITEQSSLMKALNRTIEAKNEELRDHKLRKESMKTSFIEKVNLEYTNFGEVSTSFS